jgi:hypothetical protein
MDEQINLLRDIAITNLNTFSVFSRNGNEKFYNYLTSIPLDSFKFAWNENREFPTFFTEFLIILIAVLQQLDSKLLFVNLYKYFL